MEQAVAWTSVKAPEKEAAVTDLFERVEDAAETVNELERLLDIEQNSYWAGTEGERVVLTDAMRSMVREGTLGVCLTDAE